MGDGLFCRSVRSVPPLPLARHDGGCLSLPPRPGPLLLLPPARGRPMPVVHVAPAPLPRGIIPTVRDKLLIVLTFVAAVAVPALPRPPWMRWRLSHRLQRASRRLLTKRTWQWKRRAQAAPLSQHWAAAGALPWQHPPATAGVCARHCTGRLRGRGTGLLRGRGTVCTAGVALGPHKPDALTVGLTLRCGRLEGAFSHCAYWRA